MDEMSANSREPGMTGLLLHMLQRSYWMECYMKDIIGQVMLLSATAAITGLLKTYQEQVERQSIALESMPELAQHGIEALPSEAFKEIWQESAQHIYVAGAGSRLRDTTIIIALQQMAAHKAAHYQIIASFLRIAGYNDMAAVLEDCLIEEKERQAELIEIAATQLFQYKEPKE